jgi:hypothetical protein
MPSALGSVQLRYRPRGAGHGARGVQLVREEGRDESG